MLIGILVISVFDISFTYYFAWGFFWAFLFSLSSKRIIKLFCFLAAPYWLFKGVYDVLTLRAHTITEFMLLSRLEGNLIFALILLPFLLMLIRLGFSYKHPMWHMRKRVSIAIYSVLGSVTIGLFVYLFIFTPFTESRPQVVQFKEEIQLDEQFRIIRLDSGAPLGTIRVKSSDYEHTISTDEKTRIFTETEIPILLSLVKQERRFLGRKNITLRLVPHGEPAEVRILLSSTEDIILYDSNFPHKLDPEQNTAVLFIGRNPPTPLSVSFTLPGDLEVEAVVEVSYSRFPYSVSVEGEAIRVEKELIVSRKIDL
jgi:hypothetical protein